MTIVIALNVNDGMVLAADSASTMISVDANGNTGVSTVYNHANKIVNLHKGLPIGGVTWGLGSIGPLSTSTLMKNLRTRLAGKSAAHQDWTVDPEEYTIEGVARRACEYIFEECYVPAFVDHQGSRSEMGFVVGGYSSGQDTAEEYRILVKSDGTCDGPQPLLPEGEHSGLVWHGEVAAIQRLVLGFDGRLGSVLSDKLGVPENQIDGAIEVIRGNLGAQMFLPGMPIQDAIDLAVFLADLTAKFARFTPGPPTVGGTIEVAAITKHEGFKWVRRKHYYTRDLNPVEARA